MIVVVVKRPPMPPLAQRVRPVLLNERDAHQASMRSRQACETRVLSIRSNNGGTLNEIRRRGWLEISGLARRLLPAIGRSRECVYTQQQRLSPPPKRSRSFEPAFELNYYSL